MWQWPHTDALPPARSAVGAVFDNSVAVETPRSTGSAIIRKTTNPRRRNRGTARGPYFDSATSRSEETMRQ